ncbi:MAG: iron-sulfur cluster assembly accessory protein [bacterium]|nr:iron-sulfur cluster assembly accessory protein [bacterium]
MSEVMQHTTNTIPMLSLSESAVNHLISYLTKNSEHKGVRLSVKKTGCSGLSYVVDYIKEPIEGDMVMPLAKEYLICIDKSSYPFLKDMHIDYVKQGLNSKFIFNNPNQTGQCGCGESFTVG